MDPNQQQPQTDLGQQSVNNVSSVNKKTKIIFIVLFSFLTFVIITMLGLGVLYLVSDQGQKAKKTFPNFLASIASSVKGNKTTQTNAKIFAGIQHATPTPDPTANWKTFINEKYQYQIKYPQNLDDKTIDLSGLSKTWDFPGASYTDYKTIYIYPDKRREGISPSDYIDIVSKNKSCKIEESKSDFTKFDCYLSDNVRTIVAIYFRSSVIYEINITFSSKKSIKGIDFSSEIKTFNLMLSTFKYLGGEVVIPVEYSREDASMRMLVKEIQIAALSHYRENGTFVNFENTQKDMPGIISGIKESSIQWGGIVTSKNAFCTDIFLPDAEKKYCIDAETTGVEDSTCSKTEIKCVKN